ncbi:MULTISPECIES: DUF5367 family protein [Cytobacillus]|uniref:Uncharacterized protein n=1 Tax=Cytobacillus oceanisediminis 2691 TaxID=1196031 RepID=A0A160MA72_9BACI|nr:MULTISPECIES: DUF5367 family protein [Cytobacillus]MCS0822682.1 DUF5367 domain-containing protein [Cytobacillus firmus]AND39656.1 hypothetical protein A361_11070 [Cytobacillus oceanisediminis 2691]MBU8729123.1 DUF5367 domain-containing protein [Cytobacillus oceanisediminis]MCM3246561.1 DUF5367 domain-containing protein [Cytobacillus oceanisediminis]MCM3394913.1 DUF5367 domain-containing protein [Cytobacillus oceanisediminis]
MINFAWGFLLWMSATILFRLFGQTFLIPGQVFLVLSIFILAIPLIIIATYPYYYFREIPETERLKAAVQIALPGMLLDILSIIYFAKVFPNLTNDSLPLFASWLLWAYSLILITGFSIKNNNK